MEQTLGNITHYLNLRGATLPPGMLPPRWLPIEYQARAVPWTVNGGLAARRALQGVLPSIDGAFIHTMTLALGCLDLFSKTRIVVSCDATPYGKRHMRDAYGLQPQLALSERAKLELYRLLLRRGVGFVAWSSWARDSLVRDYGCADEDIAVIPPGVNTHAFAPGERDHALPRILFVGGDFVRKGGDLLLSTYRKHLRGAAELILVTREPLPPEPGVTIRNDLAANSAELRALYGSSDVFVLPTRADCYALVGMEALAAGLPLITTRVGGMPDMVRNGETGYVIDVDDAAALARVLRCLIAEPARRTAMAQAARATALARFDAQENARKLFTFVRSRC